MCEDRSCVKSELDDIDLERKESSSVIHYWGGGARRIPYWERGGEGVACKFLCSAKRKGVSILQIKRTVLYKVRRGRGKARVKEKSPKVCPLAP